METTCVCKLCYPNAIEVGEVSDECFLIFWDEKYHLITHPGHRDYIFHTFNFTPWQDPDPECEHDGDAIADVADAWLEQVEETLQLKLSPSIGYNLYKQYLSEDPKENIFGMWLFNKCGRLIEEHVNDTGTNS